MKVLHVVPSYIPAYRYGGPIFSVHGLCKALCRLGHEITVFTTNADGPDVSNVPTERLVMLDGVRVFYFLSDFPRRMYYASTMRDALREAVPRMDIVHTHSAFLWPTWAAAKAAKRARVPYVVSPRGMLVRDLIERKSRFAKAAWIRVFERPILETAAAVHVTSAAEGRELAALGLASRQLLVVPNGVDCPVEADGLIRGRALLGWREDERVVLFLGRLSWKKGLDRLIQALAHVPGATLVIAGNDEEKCRSRLLKLITKVGLADRVSFAGPVYGAAKWNMLLSADCFVLPSYSENFGNAVLEAMAAGCPVVVTPEVGLAEVVKRSGAGVVVSGDPLPLGHAINALLADAQRRAEMGRAGRRVATEEFGWASIATQMAEAYIQILSKGVMLRGHDAQ